MTDPPHSHPPFWGTLWQRTKWVHRAWRYRLRTEAHEIALVRRLLRPGDFVLDVGAHKGAFTYWMARSVRPTGRVVAFEPNPSLARSLQWLASRGRLSSVIDVVPAALSDRSGTGLLHFPGDHLGSASLSVRDDLLGPPVEVPLLALDAFLDAFREGHPDVGPVRLVKCDVESHEIEALRGAWRTVAAERPILLVETGDPLQSPDRLAELLDLLSPLGYEAYFLSSRTGLPRLWRGADTDLTELHSDQQQNFLFVTREHASRDGTVRAVLPSASACG